MNRLILLVFFVLLGSVSVAQVTTDVQATGRHARLIEQVKFFKSKKEREEQKTKRKAEKARRAKETAEVLRDTVVAMDSMNYSIGRSEFPNDSLSLSQPEYEVGTHNKKLASASEKRGEDLALKNGLTEASGSDDPFALERPSVDIPGQELPGVRSPEGLDVGQIPDLPHVNINPGAMNMVKMKDLMNNISFEKLDDAHLSMKTLKETYSEVPSLVDTSTWVKSRSLKGQPVIDRFFVGGNVSIPSTDPFSVDINLQAGFKLDRRWSVGVGVIWRETLTKSKDSTLISPGAHGWSVFSRYKFGKGFFVMGEYSTLQNSPILREGPGLTPWQNQYLLGVGRQFSIANFIEMSTTILYDFNYRHNDLHPRPFIIRVGYTISKPNFKKRKFNLKPDK